MLALWNSIPPNRPKNLAGYMVTLARNASQSQRYTPVLQPDGKGVEITGVSVTHTELRTYIEITAKIPQTMLEDGICFRFPPDSPYANSSTGGYTEELEPGVYRFTEEMVKTDLGDSFSMELISVFGPEGKTVLDTVEFVKEP